MPHLHPDFCTPVQALYARAMLFYVIGILSASDSGIRSINASIHRYLLPGLLPVYRAGRSCLSLSNRFCQRTSSTPAPFTVFMLAIAYYLVRDIFRTC